MCSDVAGSHRRRFTCSYSLSFIAPPRERGRTVLLQSYAAYWVRVAHACGLPVAENTAPDDEKNPAPALCIDVRWRIAALFLPLVAPGRTRTLAGRGNHPVGAVAASPGTAEYRLQDRVAPVAGFAVELHPAGVSSRRGDIAGE